MSLGIASKHIFFSSYHRKNWYNIITGTLKLIWLIITTSQIAHCITNWEHFSNFVSLAAVCLQFELHILLLICMVAFLAKCQSYFMKWFHFSVKESLRQILKKKLSSKFFLLSEKFSTVKISGLLIKKLITLVKSKSTIGIIVYHKWSLL